MSSRLTGRLRAAFGCHLLVALAFLVVGVVYLVAPQWMPYHERVADTSWDSLSASMRTLLLAFLRGSGAAMLAGALAVLVLLAIPFRRGERWAQHAVPAIGLVATLPLLGVMFWLEHETGASVPLLPVVAAVALQVAGWALALSARSKAGETRR